MIEEMNSDSSSSSGDEEEEELLQLEEETLLAVAGMASSSQKKTRRWWVRPTNWQRPSQGDFDNLFAEIRTTEGPVDFHKYTRMSKESFDTLFALIGPKIEKQSVLRTSLPPAMRLLITLRYLATGHAFQDLRYQFRCGTSTISAIVRETCDALWELLRKDHVKFSQTADEWRAVEKEFREQWNFPLCVGAIDGKHIVLKCPKNSGSLYFNYKKTFSIVLLAACDAHYCFTFANIGSFGHNHDAGIFSSSELGQKFEKDELCLPPNEALPGTDIKVPFCFVADDAFPLRTNLQKPFPLRGLSRSQRIYNYRLSRARRIIECTFGIMSQKWRVLLTGMWCESATAHAATRAIVVLHNFLRQRGDRQYLSKVKLQEMNKWVGSLPDSIPPPWQASGTAAEKDLESGFAVAAEEIKHRYARNSLQAAVQNRELFMHYFEKVASTPSQYNL